MHDSDKFPIFNNRWGVIWEEINDRLNQLGQIEKTISILGNDNKDIEFDKMINIDNISKINDLDTLLTQPLTSNSSVTNPREEKQQLIKKIQEELDEMDKTEFWKGEKAIGSRKGKLLPLSKLTIDGELILQGKHYDDIMKIIGWKLPYSEYRGEDEEALDRENTINGLFLYWYIYYLEKNNELEEGNKYQGYSAGGQNAGKWNLISQLFLSDRDTVNLKDISKYTKISDIFKNITPKGTFSNKNYIDNTDIKEDSIIGTIYKKKEKLIDNTYKVTTQNATNEQKNIEQTISELRYYYLLILNYVNRIYEGYKINETLKILQLITKKRSKPNLLIGYEPGFSLLELFCCDYLTPPVSKEVVPRVPGYSNEEPFLNVEDTKLQQIFDEEVIGILALDIREVREKEVLMKEDEYDTLAINSIYQYFNTYNIMSVVDKESDFFVSGISNIAKLVNSNVDFIPKQLNTSIRSSIESMYSFATGLLKPYFVKQEDPLLKKNMRQYEDYNPTVKQEFFKEGGGNKIINQNIRVKELSKLKKLYKELNKK